MGVEITESLRHSLTVTDSSYSLTLLAGSEGAAGPNTITSATSSDGTANIQANTLTAGAGDFTTLTVGNNNVFSVNSAGDVATDGDITAADGDITVSVGDITVSTGNIPSLVGNVSGSAGDFTTLAVGSSDQFSVSSAGDVGTSGDVTLSDGDVVATVGDITALAGNVSAPNIFASADLGYSSGGTETQENSITTGVTLDAPSGVITCVPNTYSANDSSVFVLSNTHIGANDVVVVSLQVGHDKLYASVTATTTGNCSISVRNGGNGNVAATVKINFAVIKVATS